MVGSATASRPEHIPRCEMGLEAGDSAQPAYARLFGPSIDFYMRTTQLDIGTAHCSPNETLVGIEKTVYNDPPLQVAHKRTLQRGASCSYLTISPTMP